MEKSMLAVPEYSERNGNVYLVLRNRISLHSKTIGEAVMEKIEKDWKQYNDTQRKILFYIFTRPAATLGEIVDYVQINENTVRTYLNQMIEDGMLDKISQKQRDKNALYCFKKQ